MEPKGCFTSFECEEESKSYRVEKDKVWKTTLTETDGLLPFINFNNKTKEFDKNEMRSLSNKESFILGQPCEVQTFQKNQNCLLKAYKGSILYSTIEDWLYKVAEVKNYGFKSNEETNVWLISFDMAKERMVAIENDNDEFVDSVYLEWCIMMSKESEIMEIKHNLDHFLYQTFDDIGQGLTFFFNGEKINEKTTLQELPGILSRPSLTSPAIKLLAVKIDKPLFIFKRFPEMKTRAMAVKPAHVHAISFISQSKIELAGFSTHKTERDIPYLVDYEIEVNSERISLGQETVEKSKHIISQIVLDKKFNGWEDGYFYRLRIPKAIEINPNSKVTIIWKFTLLDPSERRLRFFMGIRGRKYKEIMNEHPDLFEIQDAPSRESQGWTNYNRGLIGEILYHLAD